MEIIINTFGKFKGYKEKRIRTFFQEYNGFCGIPWNWIKNACVLLILIVLLWEIKDIYDLNSVFSQGTTYKQFMVFINQKDCLKFNFFSMLIGCLMILFLILIMVISFRKYYLYLQIQSIIYSCLEKMSEYEKTIYNQIEKSNCESQIQYNEHEIAVSECFEKNLTLKCENIDILCQNPNSKCLSASCANKCKNRIKKNNFFLQEKYNTQQQKNKSSLTVNLLKSKNQILKTRMERIVDTSFEDKQILQPIENVLHLKYVNKYQKEKIKGEMKILILDLMEVVSQIKIK